MIRVQKLIIVELSADLFLDIVYSVYSIKENSGLRGSGRCQMSDWKISEADPY